MTRSIYDILADYWSDRHGAVHRQHWVEADSHVRLYRSVRWNREADLILSNIHKELDYGVKAQDQHQDTGADDPYECYAAGGP